jgi:methylmalonyl-CoA/ethylmalonyl-CoA epimerase
MSQPPTIEGIVETVLYTDDLMRAVAFYRDVLGMRFLFEAPPAMAFFDCGGIRLMLSLPTEPALDHASSILYFRVDDIAAAHAALVAKGVAFRDPPHVVARLPGREVWIAHFDDSEGNLLALTAEKSV